MESFLHITKNYGNFDNYIVYLGGNKNRTNTWHQSQVGSRNSNLSKSISHFIDLAMVDYKSEHCKTNLQNYSQSSVPGGEFIRFHTIIALV